MPTLPNGSPGAGITFRWTDEYSESSGPEGVSIQAKVHTDWSEDIVQRFPAGMLGTSVNFKSTILRKVPYTMSGWPGAGSGKLYCTRCDLTGGIGYVSASTGNGWVMFNPKSSNDTAKAVWSVEFAYLGYDVKSDESRNQVAGTGKELIRFVTRKTKPSVEAIPVPGTEWKWSGTTQYINEPTTVLSATKELEYTWYWVPFPYRESIWNGRMAQVNSATFDGQAGNPSYDTGTVYFAGYEQTDPIPDAAGNICCHVTMRFLYRRTGWNKFYRPGSGWADVVSYDGARYPFTPSDLQAIFD